MTSTRETCSDGALTVVSARTCMRVLGDWHRCAGCETSKLVRCAGQLDQLPGDSGLRRLLSSRPVSPAAAGICPLGGARPAPSAHEHPSSGFRAKLSSRKGRRQLLSRGSMASAAHTREIRIRHAVTRLQAVRTPKSQFARAFLSCPAGRNRKLHLRPCPAPASTSANAGVITTHAHRDAARRRPPSALRRCEKWGAHGYRGEAWRTAARRHSRRSHAPR